MAGLMDKDLVYNIFHSICRIKYYMHGLSEKKFDEDFKTRDAIKFNLTVIGWSANKLSEAFFKKYSNFPFLLDILRIADQGLGSGEGLWNFLKDKETGLLHYYDVIEKMLIIENPEEAAEFNIRLTDEKQNKPLSTNYQYPIHSKNSTWTVKKK